MIIFNDKSLIIRIGKNSDLKEIKNIDKSLKITINKNEQTQKYNALKQAINNKNLIISSTKSTVIGYLWYEYLWGYIPFISLIRIHKSFHRKGIGEKMIKFLERKISTEKVETSGIAALTFGDLIYDMVRVDQRYIKGVDFSRPSKDLSSVFKIGKQNISESPETLNILHERNYSGYTHEFVTHQWARNRGEEVIIPEKFNQKGYDAIYNGEKFQIKFNSVDAIREHRLNYPDIKVRSDIEAAEAYKEKFPEGPWCKKGDWIIFGRYAGSRIKIDDGELRLLNDDEILATIQKPEDILHMT